MGNAALEFIPLLKCFERGQFPRRYSRFWFWVARAGFAAVGGTFAWAAYTPGLNKFFYIDIGAATQGLLAQIRDPAPSDRSDSP